MNDLLELSKCSGNLLGIWVSEDDVASSFSGIFWRPKAKPEWFKLLLVQIDHQLRAKLGLLLDVGNPSSFNHLERDFNRSDANY